MSNIHIKRSHKLPRDVARARVEEIARDLKKKLDANYAWKGDSLQFKRTGASGSIDVGEMPWHPIYASDGRKLYVPNKGSDNISVVDMRTRAVVTTITGNGLAEPYGSALSPDGRHVFFSNSNSKGTYVPAGGGNAADTGTITVIDTATDEVVKVIEVGKGPTGIGTRRAR